MLYFNDIHIKCNGQKYDNWWRYWYKIWWMNVTNYVDNIDKQGYNDDAREITTPWNYLREKQLFKNYNLERKLN